MRCLKKLQKPFTGECNKRGLDLRGADLFTTTILLLLFWSALFPSHPQHTAIPGVIPTPQLEKYGEDMICLAEPAEPVFISVSGSDPATGAIGQGLALLSGRLEFLGKWGIRARKNGETPNIVLQTCSAQKLHSIIRSQTNGKSIQGERLLQACALRAQSSPKNRPLVTIHACEHFNRVDRA